jgi:alkylhydroperoxidase family enzyme
MNQQDPPSARLDPLPPEHSPDLNEEFDSFFKTLGFVPNSVLTMQRKPKLAKAFIQMQRALWDPESKVDRGLKRLIAHVASRTTGDAYSMAHTASGALHFGISPEKLAAVRDYRSSLLFSPAECAAFELAVAASSSPNAVSDATFMDLRKYWSEEQIVEIVGVIAMAGFLARWNVTMATPIEDEPNKVGEKYLAALGWRAGPHRRIRHG